MRQPPTDRDSASPAARRTEQRDRADLLARIKPHAQAWYAGWHDGLVDQPFYRVNSRG